MMISYCPSPIIATYYNHMSKVALSLADKLAHLRQIPQHLLPGTLKHKIMLPKLTELKL